MSHEVFSRPLEAKGSTDRNFGLVFAAFFLVLATLSHFSKLPFSLNPAYLRRCPFLSAYPDWTVHALSLLFVAIGLVFLIFAVLFPKALASLNWLGTRFGLLLHRLISPLILGLPFFVIFTPIGVVRRLGGVDPLRLRFDPETRSYWIDRIPAGPHPESLKDQL